MIKEKNFLTLLCQNFCVFRYLNLECTLVHAIRIRRVTSFSKIFNFFFHFSIQIQWTRRKNYLYFDYKTFYHVINRLCYGTWHELKICWIFFVPSIPNLRKFTHSLQFHFKFWSKNEKKNEIMAKDFSSKFTNTF